MVTSGTSVSGADLAHGASADPDAIDRREIAAAISGDGEAYRRLIERYQPEISRQVSRFSRDAAVRAELVHEVFVEAYLSLRSFQGSSPWLHWLRKVAVRVGYRHWTRRRGREREIALPETAWQQLHGALPLPEEASEAAEVVYAALAQLSPSDRLILTLIHLDGCTVAEAADRAGWTITGAKVRAFRARRRMRKLLEGVSHAE